MVQDKCQVHQLGDRGRVVARLHQLDRLLDRRLVCDQGVRTDDVLHFDVRILPPAVGGHVRHDDDDGLGRCDVLDPVRHDIRLYGRWHVDAALLPGFNLQLVVRLLARI